MEAKAKEFPRETHANFTVFASLVSGFLLLITGFFAGWYWQGASGQNLVKVEVVENAGAPVITPVTQVETEAVADPALEKIEAETIGGNCQFVGSKNSDKYHSPDSAPAKRILAENKVCFASEEEAIGQGYEEGTVN